MKSEELHHLLEEIAAGRVEVDDALSRMEATAGIDQLGFARLDTDRRRRLGMAEVVFAPGKSDEQLLCLVERLLEHHGEVLVTRLEAARAPALLERFDALEYHPVGRILRSVPGTPRCPPVAVVSAGTSDQEVAEEAALVLETLAHPVDRIRDVGVAGIHRVLAVRERLLAARVLVVVAGMEGALPSVVAGLVPRPVIAVPTSVGYGAAFGGLAALLGMLNTCAGGVGVVNIDNGFGAATLAHRIAPAREDHDPDLDHTAG